MGLCQLSNAARPRRGTVRQQRRRHRRPPHFADLGATASHSSVECGARLLLFFEPSS
jgi:hypothetical protein